MAGCGSARTAATKWRHGMNLPLSQFYHVSVDERDPYQVYGGLQDNSLVGRRPGISRRHHQQPLGKSLRRRRLLGVRRPGRPQLRLCRVLRAATSRGSTARRCEKRDIQPKPGFKEKLRFNWNTPIALSPNEKGTIYIGSQFLFRTPRPRQELGPDFARPDDQRPAEAEAGSSRAGSRSIIARPRCTPRSIRSPKARARRG